MNILLSLLMIVLGCMAVEDKICDKVPALKGFFNVLDSQEGYWGIAGMFFGFIWLLEVFSLLFHIISSPLLLIGVWASALVLLSLGLIFGYDFMCKIVGEPVPPFILKLSLWREKLLTYKKEIGVAGIVLGLLMIAF